MIASSSVVLANLAYLLGAVVFAVIGGTLVWLRHRQPKSVDANVESFNRGLRALAPETIELQDPAPGVTEVPRIEPQRGGLRIIRSDIDLTDEDRASDAGLPHHDDIDLAHDNPGAEEDAGERAGAESG